MASGGTSVSRPVPDRGRSVDGRAAGSERPPTSENLNAYLDDFYRESRIRVVHFPDALPAEAAPFDVLIINICSLAWRDVEAGGPDRLTRSGAISTSVSQPLPTPATSYSGRARSPAAGQLRADQPPGPLCDGPSQCLLFENLAQLGFCQAGRHGSLGAFGNYLTGLQQYARLDVLP